MLAQTFKEFYFQYENSSPADESFFSHYEIQTCND